VFGLLVLLGKLAASRLMHVDNPPQDLAGDFYRVLLMPASSVAGFLWFIYVLSIYLLLVPALFRLIGRRPMLVFIAALALQLGDWPQLFMLDRAVEYLPFFAGGMLLWMHRAAWARIAPAALGAASLAFVALLALAQWHDVPKWLVGAASVPAVLAWMQRLPAAPQGWLAALGRASLAIYLMNTIAIGLAKGLLLKLLPWHGVNFLLYFPLLTLAGVALPLLVASFAKRHAPRAARYLGAASSGRTRPGR
ncbi:MAG: acyltransferase family protein, partial [Burkholderiales bacterium]